MLKVPSDRRRSQEVTEGCAPTARATATVRWPVPGTLPSALSLPSDFGSGFHYLLVSGTLTVEPMPRHAISKKSRP